MKKFTGVFIGLLIAVLLAACGSTAKTPDLTDVISYYVRADGDDRNAGTSEDAPFKTLAKALDAASKTSVKKITVIGTLVGETTTDHLRPIPLSGMDLIDKHPLEILITGKPDAAANEKAILTSDRHALVITNAAIRLENIEISGCQRGISVTGGILTLAKGVRITNNKERDSKFLNTGIGVAVFKSLFVMRDDAEISHNEGSYNAGIFLTEGSAGLLLDNALVAHNAASVTGGGIGVALSVLHISDNATVSDNSTGDAGGGIAAYNTGENGRNSEITISGNAVVTRNSAKVGGGIFLGLGSSLSLDGNAKITENTASVGGGGIFGTRGASVRRENEAKAIVENNQAPLYPNITIN